MSKFKQAFITGCDENTEWQLEWFIKNFKKHTSTPIILADFGMSPDLRKKMFLTRKVDDIIDVPKQFANGWFLKPKAMLKADADETCWIDTDIQVLKDMSGVFNYIEDEKLGMVRDNPWTIRQQETWHNSGIVVFRNKPLILKMWAERCALNPSRGDQEVLHPMVGQGIGRLRYISEVPNIYNWLRIQILDGQDDPNKKCIHWTGQQGKLEIRKLIYNE